MKITETEMRGLITGKAMPADIFVGESLAAYLVRKFKSLHKERDELAAAHSELRESMAAIHNTIRLDGVNTSLGALLSASKRAHEASLPTDAYLNSVRAEGVELAADFLKLKNTVGSTDVMAYLLNSMAFELRAGKDGE